MNFSPHTKIRKEKFGTVVFETLREKIFITDSVGAEILDLIKQGNDLPQIVGALRDSYDGDPGQIAGDIGDFVAELKANNIIVS